MSAMQRNVPVYQLQVSELMNFQNVLFGLIYADEVVAGHQ